MNLQGKVALITGGRRVGRELADLLSARGTAVAMTYRSSRAVIEDQVRKIEASGGKALAIEADLSRADQAEHAVVETIRAFGRLDVLVNMASIYRRTPFDRLVPADFDDMIAANLAAPYHVAIAAAQRMRTQTPDQASGLKGKIVNVGDWAVERPYRDFLPYLAAKGGLRTLTLGLAKELAPEITVNIVEPAMVEPPPDLSEEAMAKVLAATPLARRGYPSDVNGLILYLLEGTDFATGGTFRVDGGRFLGVDPD